MGEIILFLKMSQSDESSSIETSFDESSNISSSMSDSDSEDCFVCTHINFDWNVKEREGRNFSH